MTDRDHPAINLFIQGFETTPLETMSARTEDLIRIAAFVYRADQLVRRGGRKDPHGARWTRTFGLCIPVRDFAFWSREEVQERLRAVLVYATDDIWMFGFSPLPKRAPRLVTRRSIFSYLPKGEPTPGSIVLFSGGIDSLVTLIEAQQRGEDPLALGHWSSEFVRHLQQGLIRAFNRRLPGEQKPVLFGIKLHAKQGEAIERTRRTRGFLFACLGGSVAAEMGAERVYLADNGPISLNLPINHQLLGAHVSRSTHPIFLRRVNDLMQYVFDSPAVLSNPLWSRTRVDTLQTLVDNELTSLIPLTNSCSRWSRQTLASPYCGACSQCIDRRFATLAAGLESVDPGDRYATDVLRDHLANWDEQMLAVSYVRFAQRIVVATDDELMTAYPELFDAILPDDPTPDTTFDALVAMLRRHSQAVVKVLEQHLARAVPLMAQGRLVPSSLIAIAGAKPGPSPIIEASFADTPRPIRLATPDTNDAVQNGMDVDTMKNVFAFNGESWDLVYEGLSATMPEAIAMRRIAYLLEHPDVEFTATELLFATNPNDQGAAMSELAAKSQGLSIIGYGDGGLVGDKIWKEQLEERAKAAMREIDAARSDGDREREEQLEAEIKHIARELNAGMAPGYRFKAFNTIATDQRETVSRSIVRVLPKIKKKHPDLARHLELAIHRSSTFSYRPDRPLVWHVAYPPKAA